MYSQGRAGRVPHAFGRSGDHAERVLAKGKVREVSRATRAGFGPLFIETFEPIPEADILSTPETNSRVDDIESGLVGFDPDEIRGSVNGVTVDRCAFDDHRRGA